MSTTAAPPTDVSVAHYGRLLRRRGWVIVLGLVVGLGIAGAALTFVPKTYTSTAAVLVQDDGTNGAVANGRTSSPINLDTEAQIVTSAVVAELANGDLGTDQSTRDLVKHVTVTVPANTSVLNIAFSAGSPAEAQAGATAFANAYLQNRKELSDSRISQQRDALQSRISDAQDRLQAVGEKIASLPRDSAERAFQQSQQGLLVKQIEALNTQYVDLGSGDIDVGSVITGAQLPTQPSDPNPLLLGVSGVMAGFLGGLVLAFVLERLDTRIRDRHELERMGLDVLIGRVVVPTDGIISSPKSARHNAEALRQVRNALLAQLRAGHGSILVTGVSDGETGSAFALNLSATIARSGMDVIHVSADTRLGEHPLAKGAEPGLADVLLGRVPLEEALLDVKGEPGLHVILPGSDGSLYSELLQRAQFQQIVGMLKKRTQFVVVDAAPVLVNADAQTLATYLDGVLLVVSEKQTKRGEVLEAIEQMGHVSAPVVGAVMAHDVAPGDLETRPQLARQTEGPAAAESRSGAVEQAAGPRTDSSAAVPAHARDS